MSTCLDELNLVHDLAAWPWKFLAKDNASALATEGIFVLLVDVQAVFSWLYLIFFMQKKKAPKKTFSDIIHSAATCGDIRTCHTYVNMSFHISHVFQTLKSMLTAWEPAEGCEA